jgi:hypothetical protein
VFATLLVETLTESQDICALYDTLSSGPERERLEKRQAVLDRIIRHLLEKYVCLNQNFANLDIATPITPPTTKLALEERELRQMQDSVLLRYGAVLRYICAAEVSTQDMPLCESVEKLRLAQAEWRKRFGESAIAESF